MQLMQLVTHEEIAARAHTIWEERGRPDGCELDHWLRAERELQKERRQADEIRAGMSAPAPHPTSAAHGGIM